METVELEPSTNTHVLSASKIETEDLGNGTIKMQVNGDGVVSHGEHGSVKTESDNVIKYNQKEHNPIQDMLQSALD